MRERQSPIARAVRVRRLRRQLTQEALAEVSGVSLPTIKRIEGGRTPSLATLQKLADALRIPPAVLLRRPARGRKGGTSSSRVKFSTTKNEATDA